MLPFVLTQFVFEGFWIDSMCSQQIVCTPPLWSISSQSLPHLRVLNDPGHDAATPVKQVILSHRLDELLAHPAEIELILWNDGHEYLHALHHLGQLLEKQSAGESYHLLTLYQP